MRCCCLEVSFIRMSRLNLGRPEYKGFPFFKKKKLNMSKKNEQVHWDNLPQVTDYSYDSGRSIKDIMKELHKK